MTNFTLVYASPARADVISLKKKEGKKKTSIAKSFHRLINHRYITNIDRLKPLKETWKPRESLQSPSNISNLFSSANVIHTYSTRFSSAGNLYTKCSSLTHQIKSFSQRGVIIWNSIPLGLRKLSKSCFKNKMRHYLLQILNQEEDYVGIRNIMSHLQKVTSASLRSIHYRFRT